MPYRTTLTRNVSSSAGTSVTRLRWFRLLFSAAACVLIGRLFVLQVVDHGFWNALAAGQHDISQKLFPRRGSVYLRDTRSPEKLFPVATNRDAYVVYADPRKVADASSTARALAPLLALPDAELYSNLAVHDDPYEPLKHAVPDETVAAIRALKLPGIDFARESLRFYPDPRIGGHLIGFVGSDEHGERRGRYGIEARYDEELAGKPGELTGERDIAGRLIPVAARRFVAAVDGADLVLTIDRTIQYVACERLRAAVAKHGADGGTVVIMEPATGKVLALCSVPDFDPNSFASVTDSRVFTNPATLDTYEPGSIMKPFTLAAAIDAGAVNPGTTYVDTGSVQSGGFTIKNSDGKAHGLRTMTEVLEESLNTGAIFAMRSIGQEKFRATLEAFGFGEKTKIDLTPEAAGNLGEVGHGTEIYALTASFGQGITVTPVQLAAAYGALANGGKLMRPHVVEEIRRADGSVTTIPPAEVRRVVSERTAVLLGGMLTSVVENGHGKRAGVKGYYVAGKTGTAQIPNPNGPGYLADEHIGSFVGFAPVSHPRFVMVVRLNRPKDVEFAESSAAPLFGELAAFMLQYYGVPPERLLR